MDMTIRKVYPEIEKPTRYGDKRPEYLMQLRKRAEVEIHDKLIRKKHAKSLQSITTHYKNRFKNIKQCE